MTKKLTLLTVVLMVLIPGIQALLQAQPLTPPSGYIVKNMAPGKKINVSGTYNKTFTGTNAIDGNSQTLWASPTDQKTQWLYIDLGKPMQIDGLTIAWFDKYFAISYEIAVSDDLGQWIFVHSQTNGTGGIESIRSTQTARYVGILLKEKNDIAYVISEFEICRFIPKVFTFSISPSIIDPITNIPELTDGRLLLDNGNTRILDLPLTASNNMITVNTLYDTYELYIEKSGYYTYNETISLCDIVNADISPTLEIKGDSFKPQSMHISSDDYLPTITLYNLKMSGDYGFNLNNTNQMQIIDFSDITHPVIVGQITETIDSFVVNDHYLFISQEGFIKIYSLENKAQPQLFTTITLPFTNALLFIDDNRLMIQDKQQSQSRFYIYDITDIQTIDLVYNATWSKGENVRIYNFDENIINFLYEEYVIVNNEEKKQERLCTMNLTNINSPKIISDVVIHTQAMYSGHEILGQSKNYIYCHDYYFEPPEIHHSGRVSQSISIRNKKTGNIVESDLYYFSNAPDLNLQLKPILLCGIDNSCMKYTYKKDSLGNQLSLISHVTGKVKSFNLIPQRMKKINNHAMIIYDRTKKYLLTD